MIEMQGGHGLSGLHCRIFYTKLWFIILHMYVNKSLLREGFFSLKQGSKGQKGYIRAPALEMSKIMFFFSMLVCGGGGEVELSGMNVTNLTKP